MLPNLDNLFLKCRFVCSHGFGNGETAIIMKQKKLVGPTKTMRKMEGEIVGVPPSYRKQKKETRFQMIRFRYMMLMLMLMMMQVEMCYVGLEYYRRLSQRKREDGLDFQFCSYLLCSVIILDSSFATAWKVDRSWILTQTSARQPSAPPVESSSRYAI